MLTIQRVEGGFPHSEILGSKLVRSSPRLIAAYHVLHRLSAPRHPPDALTTLDYSHDPCPLGSAQDRQRKTCLLDFSKRHVLLAKHIRRSRLRAGAGSQELGCPACRICCLFTISNIRAHPRRAGHEPHLTRPNINGLWWSLSGSNRRPEACKATALPAELRPPWRSQGFRLGLRRRQGRPSLWLPRASARAPGRACDAVASNTRQPLAKAERPPATSRRAPR